MPVRPAQLEDVFVLGTQFEVTRGFASDDLASISYDVEPTVEIDELEVDEAGVLSSSIVLTAEVRFSRADQVGGPYPFDLAVVLEGKFRWGPDEVPPSQDLARGWLEYNGMYLMWPYLRSYLSMLTGMSELPRLMIYTMNVPKPPVIAADNESVGDGAISTQASGDDLASD